MNENSSVLKKTFHSQKVLASILIVLLVVNIALVGLLFLKPSISVEIKNNSKNYRLLYTQTKEFTEFIKRNNAAAAKAHISKKTKIEIIVTDEAIKSSMEGIIGVYPIIGIIDPSKSTKNKVTVSLKIDPARLAKLNQSKIDDYVQQFIVSPLYFQSHPDNSIKQKSDFVYTYLQQLKKMKQPFTLVKK